MAHFSKVWPGGLTGGVTTATAANFATLDLDHSKAINGDDGGTWSPTNPIIIGGAGMQFSALYTGERALVTANSPYTWDSLGSDLVLLVDYSAGGSGGTVTLLAPAAAIGRVCIIKDYKQNSATNPITIHRNNVADTIDGVTADLVLQKNNGCVWLLGVTGGWITLGGI